MLICLVIDLSKKQSYQTNKCVQALYSETAVIVHYLVLTPTDIKATFICYVDVGYLHYFCT